MRFTVGDMQGWRLNMEDSHIANPNFAQGQALFGVFDGHGGQEVAGFTEAHYPNVLKN